MATNRVVELRNVMEKFSEFYNQKLCETEEISVEPHRIKTKCRVLEHYVDDVKLQIEHFLTCIEKWDVDSVEKTDKLKRALRENSEKAEFFERQLRNSETQREQVELAIRELGVRCESLEKTQRFTKHLFDSVTGEISRLTEAINTARSSGKLNELAKCQPHIQQPEIARLVQAIASIDSISSFSKHQDDTSKSSNSDRRIGENELLQAQKEITDLTEKLRDSKAALSSVTQREQDVLRELHAKDREIAKLRSSTSEGSPSRFWQHRLDDAENDISSWKAKAEENSQQLANAMDELRRLQNGNALLVESESAVAYLQRELSSERARCESAENSAKEREQEVETYRSRYEAVLIENDRLESLLSDRKFSSAEQDDSYRAAIFEREETVARLQKELVHVTKLLQEQSEKVKSAEDQTRSLTAQLDTLKTLQSTSFSTTDSESGAFSAEQYFARELSSKTQNLTDSVRKLENQLETTRHEKIVLDEEVARLKSRFAAEQSALQNHADRLKDELRAQEQVASKMRVDMRLVWEEKLRVEHQMRELLDSQAVDRERNKTFSGLLQQREEEAGTLRGQVAGLSEQLGEKDGVISQLRSEIARLDSENLTLHRETDNTCEVLRARDNHILELKTALDRACETYEATKQELARCEAAMKRMAEELSELRQKAADARMEAERERTRAVAVETMVAKSDSDRLYTEQQVAAAENEASRLRNEVIELNEKVVSLDNEIAEVRHAYEQLRRENYELSQSLECESRERRVNESRLNELEMANHLLDEQLQAYRHDVSVRDQAILRLRAETDQAVARCQSAQEEMESKDADIRRVAQRAREQQLELRQALENLAVMEERLAEAEARIAAVSQEREVAVQDARNTEMLIEQLRRETQLLRTEQETDTARLKQANDLLVVERDAVRADVAELVQRLEHAREEIMAFSRANSDMQIELQQLNARCRQAELLVAEQNTTISDLRQRLSSANEEQDRLQDEERLANIEVDTLRERCSDLSERLASSESRCDEAERLGSEMKLRVADLEVIVIRMEADLQQSRQDLRASRNRQSELESAIIQLKDLIDNERQAAESVAFRLQAEEIMTRDLKATVARVCQDNSVLEESHSRVLADFKCYETDHRFTNDEVAERDKRIDELELAVDSAKCDVTAAQHKMTELEETIDTLKAELSIARDSKSAAIDEIRQLEEKLALMRHNTESQASECEHLARCREKEIEDLRRQLSEAHADNRLSKDEIEAHLERIHALEIDISATTSDLHQREDIISRLECAIQELRVELDGCRASLRESEGRVNMMLTEVETAKRDAADSRQAYKQAASEQAAAQQKAQVAEERAVVSENEMNNKVAECVRLEGQVRRFQNEMRSMQERLQDAEEDRANLRENLQRVKSELSQARDNLARFSQENGCLRQQVAKAEMELCGIREQHKIAAEQISHQEQILAHLQEELRQERAKNVEASRGSNESRRVGVELRESLSNAERQIRELQNRLTSRDHAVEDSQRELLECQAKLKQTRDELGDMESQLRAVKISHAAAEREASVVGDRVGVLEKKVTELLADLDRTRDSLRNAQSIACDREKDAVILQNELARTRNQAAELATQMNDLNRQLVQAQQDASRLRDQNAANNAQLSKVEEYSSSLKEQVDAHKGAAERLRELQGRVLDSEQKMAKMQSEAESLKSDVNEWRKKYEDSVRDIKHLKDALAVEQKENQNKIKAEAAATMSSANRVSERQREQSHAIAKISAERDQLYLSLSQAESVLNDKETKIAEMRNHIAEQDHLIRDLVAQCKASQFRNGSGDIARADKSSMASSMTLISSSSSTIRHSQHRPQSPPVAAQSKLDSRDNARTSHQPAPAVSNKLPIQTAHSSVATASNKEISRIPTISTGTGTAPQSVAVKKVQQPSSAGTANGQYVNGRISFSRHSPDKQHQ